jgi:LPS O-antigen subunit length determinant protein (WzzB/FepE family)
MRRLVRLAAWLYPAAWRTRYGAEFEALLEDVAPVGRDVWDVLRGALTMQMTVWNFGKITAICALAGLVAAGALVYMLPEQYVSTAVLRLAPAASQNGASPWVVTPQVQQHLEQMQQQVLSRHSLSEIITRPALDLYKTDRTKLPLEDIVQDMRNKGIRIYPVPPAAFAISYKYPNKYKAQAVVRELVSRFVEENITEQRHAGPPEAVAVGLEVLDPASLPQKPSSPNWPQILVFGLVSGLLVGLVTSFVLAKPARHMLKIVAFGAAGFVVVAALSFLVPNQYVSTAVLRAGPGTPPIEQLFDSELLGKVAAAPINQTGKRVAPSVEELRRRLTIRPVDLSAPGPLTAFSISFQSTDRFLAQAVVREVVAEAIVKQRLAANGGKPWVPGTLVPPAATGLQVLDPASDPAGPSSPNRLVMSSLGLLAGLIVGAWRMRTRPVAAPA